MNGIMDYPLLVLALSLLGLWLSAQAGSYLRRRRGTLDDGAGPDLSTILAATLTLLALIIGFTFSMANSRYDQRKGCEASEANAIGTEYLRSELLPAGDAESVKGLLKRYVDQRILFYRTRDEDRLRKIRAGTDRLEAELWSAVRKPSLERQTPIVAMVAAGMNDVLNSEAYAQAAWWNRIPIATWSLMVVIAICANALLGYTAHRPEAGIRVIFILPLLLSIAFFLIADIDSPRGGLIRMYPQNLESVAISLRTQ